MVKILEHPVNIVVPAGTSAKTVTFQPPAGLVVACAIYTNGGDNTGFVSARITTDDGQDVSVSTDIRNYRDREAGYREGKKPLYFDTENKTYAFTISATENFTTDLRAQLVLVYENNFTKNNC